MNARRYSTTWMRASIVGGMRTSTTRPAATPQPLTARTTPPVATTRSGSSTKGFETLSSASASSSESASAMQISGWRLTLIPALTAEVFPPLSLRTTTSGAGPEGAWTVRMSPRTSTSSGTTRGTSRRSNASRSASNVPSLDPSSTTTTSKTG